MLRGSHVEWSEPVARVIGRYIQALADGKYPSVLAATRDCRAELARLRSRRGGEDLSGPRSQGGVYGAIWRRARALRFHGLNTFWTPAEDRVVGRYVRALLARRYVSSLEAGANCAREFARLRRSRGANWAAVPRSEKAVQQRVHRLALKGGYALRRRRFTSEEEAVFRRYTQALVAGRCRDVGPTARECTAELARLRRRDPELRRSPPRSITAVTDSLRARTRALGWRWHDERWRPDEKRIMDRWVQRLSGPRPTRVRDAARICHTELTALHRSLCRRNPALSRSYHQRTLKTVESYLARWSRAAGRAVELGWTRSEDKIVQRHAVVLLNGGYADAEAAGDACRAELQRTVWRRSAKGPESSGPRTLVATRQRLRDVAHSLGRRWPKTSWTRAEMKVCRRWIRWYEKHRGIRRLSPWDSAVAGIQEELERMDSRRSLSACGARFAKERRRLLGLE